MDAISANRVVGAPSHESSRPSPRPRNVAGVLSSGTAQAPSAKAASSAAAQPAPDRDSGMVIVRITDEVTGEIVKQIPAEELLKVDQSMEKIVGLLIDDLA